MNRICTIAVVCKERSHETRPCKIVEFGRDDPNYPQGSWGMELGNLSGRSRAGAENPRANLREADTAEAWWRYHLECRLCGLTVEAKHANLAPVLDRLAEAGVSEISLSGLGAILS